MSSIIKNDAKHLIKRKKGLLPLSTWLSYLLIFTLIISSVSLANYTATSSGDDAARVAHFSVSATEKADQPKVLTLDYEEGAIGKYVFEVLNDSEVPVKYTVTITNLPADIRVDMGSQTAVSSKTSNVITFDAANLKAHGSDSHTLVFTALDEARAGTYEGISVDVQFEQID